jgi:hypothetical protein
MNNVGADKSAKAPDTTANYGKSISTDSNDNGFGENNAHDNSNNEEKTNDRNSEDNDGKDSDSNSNSDDERHPMIPFP